MTPTSIKRFYSTVRNAASLLPLIPSHQYYTYTPHKLGTDPVSPCSQVSFTAIHCLLFVWRADSMPVRMKKKKKRKIKTQKKKLRQCKRPGIQPKQQHQSFLNGNSGYDFLRLRKYRLCALWMWTLIPKTGTEKKYISWFPSTTKTKQKTKLATWTKLKEYCESGNAASFQTEKVYFHSSEDTS